MSPDGLLAVNQESKFNITVTNTNVLFLCSESLNVSSCNTKDTYVYIHKVHQVGWEIKPWQKLLFFTFPVTNAVTVKWV